MKKPIGLWQLMGFAVTALGGTLLHFLYDWFGENKWIALFSGVNESTWEHMKLLFWPMVVYAIIQSFFFRDRNDFWCIKLKGILLGLILIPVIFYTYNGVIEKSPDWINIAIFFVAASVTYIYETSLFNKESSKCNSPKLAITTLCIIGILFMIFTFTPLKIGFFRDPLSGTYGI